MSARAIHAKIVAGVNKTKDSGIPVIARKDGKELIVKLVITNN